MFRCERISDRSASEEFPSGAIAVRACLQTAAIFLVLFSTACASNPPKPDWLISMAFEDQMSCGKYRSVQVFESGKILYAPDERRDDKQWFQIDQNAVQHLLAFAKAIPMISVGPGESFNGVRGAKREIKGSEAPVELKRRGLPPDVAAMAAEISRVAGITWSDERSASPTTCRKPAYALPAGTIWLKEDVR
jgi:hypothetical protein